MIYLNLIPSNMWYLNLRKMLNQSEWNKLSLKIRNDFNWTCYCCNITISQLKQQKYFHAHEYWLFDNKTKIVKLAAIVCICSHCHEAIHMGYASINKRHQQAFKQIMKVNKWSQSDVRNYIDASFEQWSLNSQIDWTLNLSSIKSHLNEKQISLVESFIKQNNIKYV